MPETTNETTDARERMIADFVARSGVSKYFARQQYQDVRRWAENLGPEKRASVFGSDVLPVTARMSAYVLDEVMTERGESRKFTIVYTDRETAGLEIRRILPGVVRVGDSSNRQWVELRDSGLDWFSVEAVSVDEAVLKGRAELAKDIAADWASQGIEIGDDNTLDTYFSDCLVTVALQ